MGSRACLTAPKMAQANSTFSSRASFTPNYLGRRKPDNILIDAHNDAYLIDFGGGYMDGWEDKELVNTRLLKATCRGLNE